MENVGGEGSNRGPRVLRQTLLMWYHCHHQVFLPWMQRCQTCRWWMNSLHNIPKISTFSASLGTRGRQREQGSTTTTATVDTKLVGHDNQLINLKGGKFSGRYQWRSRSGTLSLCYIEEHKKDLTVMTTCVTCGSIYSGVSLRYQWAIQVYKCGSSNSILPVGGAGNCY